MKEWTVAYSVEVYNWLEQLRTKEAVLAARSIALLAKYGVLLSEPHTRQLSGRLRELRFRLDRRAIRITYFFTGEREIALLTVFEKRSPREPREIARAERAMAQWALENES
jgi:hypothetical protein